MRLRAPLLSLAVALCSVLVLPPAQAAAQDGERLVLQGRFGLNLPFGEVADAGADGGLSLGADLLWSVAEQWAILAGYSRDAFDCGECPGADDQVRSTGMRVGIRRRIDYTLELRPWIEAGVGWSSAEYEGTSTHSESDGTVSFFGALGASFPMGNRVTVAPSFRFATYSPSDLQVAAVEVGNISSVSFELAVGLGVR